MASIGGRVSSARLIKSVRERRINHVNIKKDKTIPLKNVDKNKIKVEKMVLEPVDEEQLNIEELNYWNVYNIKIESRIELSI